MFYSKDTYKMFAGMGTSMVSDGPDLHMDLMGRVIVVSTLMMQNNPKYPDWMCEMFLIDLLCDPNNTVISKYKKVTKVCPTLPPVERVQRIIDEMRGVYNARHADSGSADTAELSKARDTIATLEKRVESLTAANETAISTIQASQSRIRELEDSVASTLTPNLALIEKDKQIAELEKKLESLSSAVSSMQEAQVRAKKLEEELAEKHHDTIELADMKLSMEEKNRLIGELQEKLRRTETVGIGSVKELEDQINSLTQGLETEKADSERKSEQLSTLSRVNEQLSARVKELEDKLATAEEGAAFSTPLAHAVEAAQKETEEWKDRYNKCDSHYTELIGKAHKCLRELGVSDTPPDLIKGLETLTLTMAQKNEQISALKRQLESSAHMNVAQPTANDIEQSVEVIANAAKEGAIPPKQVDTIVNSVAGNKKKTKPKERIYEIMDKYGVDRSKFNTLVDECLADLPDAVRNHGGANELTLVAESLDDFLARSVAKENNDPTANDVRDVLKKKYPEATVAEIEAKLNTALTQAEAVAAGGRSGVSKMRAAMMIVGG